MGLVKIKDGIEKDSLFKCNASELVVIKALSSITLQERQGINRQDVEVSKLNYNPTSLNLILNSQPGLQIRTSGDLGAQDNIYLNGLKGDQIRILLMVNL